MDQCTANDPYSITVRIKPEKIINEVVEESDKSMRVSNIDAIEENDNEIERGEDGNRDDSETANDEVINTHTVQEIKKRKPHFTSNTDWAQRLSKKERASQDPTGRK